MKRFTLIVTTLVLSLTMGNLGALAQRGGGRGGGPVGGASMGRGDMRGSNDMGHDNERMASMDHGMNMPSMSAKNAGQILSRNTELSSRLQSMLPSGTNMQQATAGFKDLGQFVAAVHVSHNLGIPFDQLKEKMTGPRSESLGKAIQQLKPEVKAKDEAKRAQKQAKQDLTESGSE